MAEPSNDDAKRADDAKPAGSKRSRRRAPGPAGSAPNRSRLHEAALAHLARFASTEAGLIRVLDRRVDRWLRAATAEGTHDPDALAGEAQASRQAVREVARALVQSGVVNDEAFAGARARSLTRAGRSRVAVSAHLAAKGVPQEVAKAALPDPETELGAALAYARRRRLGPFRTADADEDTRRKELGALARAGFPQPVAQQALRMDPEAAKALVIRLKQG
jgi:regulatory protein